MPEPAALYQSASPSLPAVTFDRSWYNQAGVGALTILSGIFHLVRVFDPAEPHRVWLGIAGLLFIVIGVVLIRHLHLTGSLIGLVTGITWIVQGLAAQARALVQGPSRANLVPGLDVRQSVRQN